MPPNRNRIELAFKILHQVGLGRVALYALYRLGLLTGHYRRLDPRLLRNARAAATSLAPVLNLPDPAALARNLSLRGKAALRREANAVVAGRFRPFGQALAPLVFSTGGQLRHWTDYERQGSFRASLVIPFSDIKFLWEPARFGWAYTLGRAFHLTRDGKYARAFWTLLERFERGNPPYQGPHWMNGQEVAIRLMALVWSAQVFAQAPASTPRRKARLALSIGQHAARIPPTLVYARSQDNNHLVTESAALYLAGVALNHLSWRELGWRWLNRALQRQISPYGEYIQHSTNYHRLVLHSALLADAVRRARGELWPAATQLALSRASHWLFSMMDPVSGRVPNLGANDGALLLPLSSSSSEDYRPTVQAAARAFLRTALPAGDWDELSIWLGLPASGHVADANAYAAENLRARDSWGYLRASSFRSRLSHMDQLHFELWWRGLNVSPDPGTYLYNAPPPWDNPLVSSLVHNCVTIDGREQMTRGGRFLVLDWFPAYAKRVLSVDPSILGQIKASHKAFERHGIRYERTVNLLGDGRWQIRDDLHFTQRRRHTIRLHWLLADGEWRLRQKGAETRLHLRLPGGWIRIVITAGGLSEGDSRVTLIRAGKVLRGDGLARTFQGWCSPAYGRKVPALSLALEATASGSCSFTTEFILPK